MRLLKVGKIFVAQTAFTEREIPKGAGFKWDKVRKRWWTDDVTRAVKLYRYAVPGLRAELEAHARKMREQIVASRAVDASIDVPVPEGLSYLPHQRAGIARALMSERSLNADEMGLGKTIQAIGVLNAESSIKKVLVICPASLRLNWRRELEKWLVDVDKWDIGVAVGGKWPTLRRRRRVIIANYDILHRHSRPLRRSEWDMMIVDECHSIKNPRSRRTCTILGGTYERRKEGKVVHRQEFRPIPARRMLFLTGTPVLNKPIELQPILGAIDPSEFGNFWKFARKYAAARSGQFGWNVDGASNLEELQEKLRTKIMVRRLKSDVLKDLPAKRRQVIELPANGCVELIDAERSAWAEQEQLMVQLKGAVELSKASSDPEDYREAVKELRVGVAEGLAVIGEIRVQTALAKIPYVVTQAEDVMESTGGKVVLFSHHHAVTDRLVEEFGDLCVRLDGRDSMKSRDGSVRRFQEDDNVRVFVAGIKSAGVGLTLTASSHVIFAELDWTPAALSQAEDRCHRIGQKDSVLVQHMVLEGSIDARMAQRLVEKQAVIDQILDHSHPASILEEDDIAFPAEEAAATHSTKQRQIALDAKGMPKEEIVLVHRKLRHLAAACDGAASRDGEGFNRIDAYIGKSLSDQRELTPRQAALGKRLVKKYHRQLQHIE